MGATVKGLGADRRRRISSQIMVEQNTEHALRIASRGFVLESGRVVLSGSGLELLSNQRVREAYLGL
jgi:ABC-type branched-subunit amino acid transport system ATPase component